MLATAHCGSGRQHITVCDEIFIDVQKLLRMCIVLEALDTINACFSGKHASTTCRSLKLYFEEQTFFRNKTFSLHFILPVTVSEELKLERGHMMDMP